MALASRTPTPDVARAFLQKLGLTHYFANVQLIPAADGYDQHSAQKDTAHFPNLRRWALYLGGVWPLGRSVLGAAEGPCATRAKRQREQLRANILGCCSKRAMSPKCTSTPLECCSETGIEYPEMLFYDDEHKNVAKVGAPIRASASLHCSHQSTMAAPAIIHETRPLPCGAANAAAAQVARLGVCSVHVSSSTGVNLRELERGLREYAAARGQRQGQDGAGS